MSAHGARFLIIGGGVAGLSTAWHLARAGDGPRTVLVEADEHLAARSSGVNAAILRTLAGDAISTGIGLRSARFLRDPPAGFSDTPLVDAFGLLLVAARERSEEIAGWIAAIDGDAPCKIDALSPEGVAALAPHFEGDATAAWWLPEEGRIDIGALVAGFARGARQGGATLRRGCAVSGLLERGGRIAGARLASGEEVEAEVTVLAAGGWAARLGDSVGSRVRLRPTRRHLMITAPDSTIDRAWPVLWYFGAPDEGEFYCRPEGGGMLLCACEIADVDPDRFDVDDDVRRAIAEKAARHLPALRAARAAHFWCGLRTLTTDGRFAIGPDPDLDGLFWVAGLGGSGMVCSAEIGRLAAAALRGEPADADVMHALSPARLAL